MDNGRMTERDEFGRIVKAGLSSETAREMIKHRWTKEEKAEDNAQKILSELGYSDDNPAPALYSNLAEIAVSQKTGAVSAIGSLLRLAHGKTDSGIVRVQAGEVCPTCGQISGGLGVELARELAEVIMKRRENENDLPAETR